LGVKCLLQLAIVRVKNMRYKYFFISTIYQ